MMEAHDHGEQDLPTDEDWDLLANARLLAKAIMPYKVDQLLALQPHESPGLGTFAVTANYVLMWDWHTARRWGIGGTACVLLHEVEHPFRGHIERSAKLDPQKANEAGDREINNGLVEVIAAYAAKHNMPDLKLPDEPLMPSDIGMPDGLLMEEYYQAEKGGKGGKPKPKKGKGGDKGKDKSGGKGKGDSKADQDGSGDADGEGKPSTKVPRAGGGWCGSCAGNPVPGEPTHGRSPADVARINRQTAERIKDWEASHGQGSVPAGLVRRADELLKPPKIAWQDMLQTVVGGAVEWAWGLVQQRFDRVSKRQGSVGFGPMSPILPRWRAPTPLVDVVIDTSGSMGKAELTRGVSEALAIIQTTSCRVRLMSADAQAGELRQVNGIEDIELVGGGGTSFVPPFEAIAKERELPQVIVYVTDGMGGAPATPPPFARTIWLLVGKHQCEPSFPGRPWGEMIHVKED